MHGLQEGTRTDAAPLPTYPVCALSRRAAASQENKASPHLSTVSRFLHDVFLHHSKVKTRHTLRVTKGYKAYTLMDFHCETCAATKARSFGLRKRGQRSDVPVDSGPTNSVSNVFDDEDSSDHGSDHDEVEVDVAYTAESPGRDLGPQPLPRFDLDRLKVWEVMFVGNK